VEDAVTDRTTTETLTFGAEVVALPVAEQTRT